MVEGLGKGAGLALLAVPMADAFVFSQAQFILSNYLGLEGAISIPHTHHCGGGAVRVLTEGTVKQSPAGVPSARASPDEESPC